MAKLFRVILPVDDINKAAEFYSNLLGSPGERVNDGRHYFECGGTILACYDAVADGDEKGEWQMHFNQNLYFAVPNLDELLEKAQTAGFQEVDSKTVTYPWGERSFYGKDPFGNPICFVDESTVFTGAKE